MQGQTILILDAGRGTVSRCSVVQRSAERFVEELHRSMADQESARDCVGWARCAAHELRLPRAVSACTQLARPPSLRFIAIASARSPCFGVFAIVHLKAFLQSPSLGKAARFPNALHVLRLKRADDATGSDFSSRGRSGGEHARRNCNGAMR